MLNHCVWADVMPGTAGSEWIPRLVSSSCRFRRMNNADVMVAASVALERIVGVFTYCSSQ